VRQVTSFFFFFLMTLINIRPFLSVMVTFMQVKKCLGKLCCPLKLILSPVDMFHALFIISAILKLNFSSYLLQYTFQVSIMYSLIFTFLKCY